MIYPLFQLYVPTKPGRVSVFPKTLYSENSTVFDFAFKNFNFTLSDGQDTKHGRLVLEMLLVHGNLKKNSVPEKRFSRDDEYTPSVFLIYNQLFGGNDTLDGFLQWKPISYLSGSRKSTQSQQANSRNGHSINITQVHPGLVTAMYDSDLTPPGVIQPVYMIFGTEGDDNNADPAFVTW